MTFRYVKTWTSSLRHPRAALCIGACTLAWGATAVAQPHWTLTWDAPEDCPQRDEVLVAVRDIVGQQIFEASAIEADGKIREVSGKFRLELRVIRDGVSQQRTVDAKACQDLLGASAVVLGLQLKQNAARDDSTAPVGDSGQPDRLDAANGSVITESQAPTKREPPKGPTAKTSSESTPSASRVEQSPASHSRSLWLGLPQAGVVVGSLPEPAWTGGVALGWVPDRWRMWVSGRYQLPQTIDAADGVAAVVDKYTVEVGVSHGWRAQAFDVAPGLFAGVDYLVARSSGENVTATRAYQPFVFLGGNLTLRWLASDVLSLALGAAGEVPLSRPSLRVQSLGEIAQISAVHLRASLGLEWNF